MITITQSVGNEGKNLEPDVLIIQKALNKIEPPLSTKLLLEDGEYGEHTNNAIVVFQRKHVMIITPDGRIDPDGRTIRKLDQMLEVSEPQTGVMQSGVIFPLGFKPAKSYKFGMRAFGTNRSKGKRKHAGVDLYAPKGTEIRAMKDGTVIQDYPFYLGTRALEIDHGDMVIRYGEISHVATGVTAGAEVARGQVIAYVGELVFKSGNKMSMLHLEAYTGEFNGALTVRSAKPYQRRADLFNPTQLLNGARLKI